MRVAFELVFEGIISETFFFPFSSPPPDCVALSSSSTDGMKQMLASLIS